MATIKQIRENWKIEKLFKNTDSLRLPEKIKKEGRLIGHYEINFDTNEIIFVPLRKKD